MKSRLVSRSGWQDRHVRRNLEAHGHMICQDVKDRELCRIATSTLPFYDLSALQEDDERSRADL